MTDHQPTKPSTLVEEPPHSLRGIVWRLGPGLIVAGSIVGSGELIGTTKTGAEAGFWLLWLILIGCVIKVFVQVELGRYSIVTGNSTMEGLNEVPGPRFGQRGNWLVWYWFLMFLASLAQLGGIVGSVGQALAISRPLTEQGRDFNAHVDLVTRRRVAEAEFERAGQVGASTEEIAAVTARLDELDRRIAAAGEAPPASRDDVLWAAIITFPTSLLLMRGRYGLVQNLSTALVASFTLVTVGNVLALQAQPSWAMTWAELRNGLSFRLPPTENPRAALATALATFGIIGVGASELVTYPYWCLEKGYARFVGPRDDSSDWGERARGWMRVMRIDAWCSMVVYTFATIAFYVLGAAILGRTGLNPEGKELVRTLAAMYEPVFGSWAGPLFLFGAFAVLYSTFFVANASHARVFSDAVRVLGFAGKGDEAYRARVYWLSGLFPLVCLMFYALIPQPAMLVLLSGVMQAIMLPMLAAAALYFRYRRGDARLRPGRLWDLFLWLSALGMLVAGGWVLVDKVLPK